MLLSSGIQILECNLNHKKGSHRIAAHAEQTLCELHTLFRNEDTCTTAGQVSQSTMAHPTTGGGLLLPEIPMQDIIDEVIKSVEWKATMKEYIS